MAHVTNEYERRRLENIKRNKALIQDLGIKSAVSPHKATSRPPTKKRKIDPDIKPSRNSARLSANPRISYSEDSLAEAPIERPQQSRKTAKGSTATVKVKDEREADDDSIGTRVLPSRDVESIRTGWTSWSPSEPPPTRDALTGEFSFSSHPSFTPNKSPEEILREGSFGGSYWRPLYSRRLGITVEQDWKELPAEWTAGLNVSKYLTSPTYDTDVNKYKVSCGQSIEEWEAAGWIAHDYDVRGWFQWYCRFFMGRRCEDDERQISRWRKCVGETGRWRRTLLKKYVQAGVRDVFDEGDDEEEVGEVSPVIHQTCHHWAFEVRQGVLDDYWRSIGR